MVHEHDFRNTSACMNTSAEACSSQDRLNSKVQLYKGQATEPTLQPLSSQIDSLTKLSLTVSM